VRAPVADGEHPWQLLDCRRTFGTRLAELKVPLKDRKVSCQYRSGVPPVPIRYRAHRRVAFEP
jgi:hypothetical protein